MGQDDSPVMPTEEAVLEALRNVIDPEVGMNVVDLGLVYGVQIADGCVRVAITMTTPACPLSDLIVEDANHEIRAIAPAAAIDVQLVWEPPWNPGMMSEQAKKQLGW